MEHYDDGDSVSGQPLISKKDFINVLDQVNFEKSLKFSSKGFN